jgi:hypothetical protein
LVIGLIIFSHWVLDFITHPMFGGPPDLPLLFDGSPNASKYRDGVATWMNPVRSLVTPVSQGLFAGSLDFKKLPVTFDTLMLHIAVALGALPQGDHRDWKPIQAWAESFIPLLG